jgi:hypothetical protein
MTTNTLGYYNPVFYAQEALIQLEKALGLAGRVYRGYEEERNAFRQGEYINIRKPSTFTAANAPDTTGQNIVTESVQVQLAYWREVKFVLTDKELSFTGERIIRDHIRPAAYALADDIDQKLAALYVDVPWFYDLTGVVGTPVVTDFTGPWQVMFDNKVPMNDPSMMHMMLNGTQTGIALELANFTQQQGAGDQGVEAQMRGTLGMKYGFNIFSNQNVQSHTAGAMADGAGAMASAHAKGATSVTIDDLTDTQTVKAGDSFVIAGNTQRYCFTEDGAVSTVTLGPIGITPPLVAAYAEDDVVTIRVDSHTANLAFHRNWAALAMAPLSEMGNDLGAQIATIQDPTTGLAIRSRVYYVGNSSEVHVALDVLYGVKTLDPNLAMRLCGA